MKQRYHRKNRAGSISLSVLAILILLPLTGWCPETATLRLVQTIPLPHVEGRLDQMAIDLGSQRLFAAALGVNTLDVIDLRSGKHIRSIGALAEPQGVLYIPELSLVCVTNGGDGSLRIFDGQTLALVDTVKFSSDADNIRYDEAKREIYVGYGRGALAIVDAKSRKHLADIRLAGHPESFQLEEAGTRIFVNVPSANHIAVVDRSRRTAVATWPLLGAGLNFPMALDEHADRLFVGCREPARVLVYDMASGKTVASLDIGHDVDDIFFDSASGRLYVSSGEGFLHVLQQADSDRYSAVAKIPTAAGARTCLFVPVKGRLYLAVSPSGKRQAEIWLYNGTKIAFMSTRDGEWEIYVMDADGTNQTRVTHISAYDDHPAWSPDRTKIAFTSYRDGFLERALITNARLEQSSLPPWVSRSTRRAGRAGASF